MIYPNLDEIAASVKSPIDEISREKIMELIQLEISKTNRQIETYKRIRRFAIKLEEFPKTTTRKIKRYLFKDLDIDEETIFI